MIARKNPQNGPAKSESPVDRWFTPWWCRISLAHPQYLSECIHLGLQWLYTSYLSDDRDQNCEAWTKKRTWGTAVCVILMVRSFATVQTRLYQNFTNIPGYRSSVCIKSVFQTHPVQTRIFHQMPNQSQHPEAPSWSCFAASLPVSGRFALNLPCSAAV